MIKFPVTMVCKMCEKEVPAEMQLVRVPPGPGGPGGSLFDLINAPAGDRGDPIRFTLVFNKSTGGDWKHHAKSNELTCSELCNDAETARWEALKPS